MITKAPTTGLSSLTALLVSPKWLSSFLDLIRKPVLAECREQCSGDEEPQRMTKKGGLGALVP